jgi:anti-sigma factor RsiW
MPEPAPAEGAHEEFEALFSDLYDGLLPEADRDRVLAHLEGCAACKAAYAELQETMKAIGGLKREPAPAEFAQAVTETIHKRSGGRFFGRRTLGDRVPFGVLLVVALVVMIGVAAVLWSSSTGSLGGRQERAPTRLPPGAKEAIPRP